MLLATIPDTDTDTDTAKDSAAPREMTDQEEEEALNALLN